AGVRTSTPSGRPGRQPGIVIRNVSSYTGNGQPVLYIIDGKISNNDLVNGASDFNNLSPNEIESITVLKDAASTAAYGARAAGGVVLVTTRKGLLNQKPQIAYSFNSGVDKRGKNADLTSAVETMELFYRMNPGAVNAGTPSDLAYMKTINNGWGYDQLAAVYRDPFVSTHNLSVSGGSSKIRYFMGGSYVKQGAFMQNLDMQKYNLRLNLTADITDNLQVFTGIALNNNLVYEPSNTSVGDVDGLYRKQLLWQPWLPVWTDGANPVDYGWIGNVGAEVRGDGGYGKTNFVKPVFDFQVTYKIPQVKGLSVSARYNKVYMTNRSKTFIKSYDMWMMKDLNTTSPNGFQVSTKDADVVSIRKSSSSGIGKPYLQEAVTYGGDYQLNLQLNYEHSFGEHNLKGWLVYERSEWELGGFNARRETFPVYTTDQWWAASGDRLNFNANGNADLKNGRKSYIGQLFYDYAGKYLASFTTRYDGSMNFPINNRWALIPSGSLGWIVSKENFFRVKGIEMLKLRASVGIVGNDNVGGWQWLQSYGNGGTIFFGTNPVANPGITYGALTNPNLTWEKTRNYNVGMDVNFLKKFNASVEFWAARTSNILSSRILTVPPTFVRSMPAENYGDAKSNGFEFSIGYNNTTPSKLRYYANANVAYSVFKIVKRDLNITYPIDDYLGKSFSRIVTFEADKILRTQVELDAFVAANPTYKINGVAPALGQIVYKDLSGPNGRPDGIIDNWDRREIKKDNNPVSIGFNTGISWKGFTLDATFNGYLHYSRFVNNLVDGNVEWNRMWRKWYTDGWTPENPNASLPKRYSINDGTNFVTNMSSTFWLKNSNFLRLKFLSIGYNIPQRLFSKIGLISGIRLYCSGSNLFVISKFNKEYYDPENGDGFSYPIMKSYNAGITVNF
ncbi:MAG TPA: SusC/RagA family TonB-linked outer membrane protein, partial [Chitinophagaceae bacterium]|nr:SusC/RagA family TonB-linked outer membrane protein [Chitinophagaceae bacterium]